MKITSPAKAFKSCVLAAAIAVPFAAGAQFNPYWDSWFDTVTQPLSEVVRVACANGTVFAMTVSDADPDAITIVRGTKCGGWETIGSIANGPAALYAKGNFLYVGGCFDGVAAGMKSITAHNIARYDITQKTWSTVGDDSLPVGASVLSIVIDSQDHLYVGVCLAGWPAYPPEDPNQKLGSFRMLSGGTWVTVGGGLEGDPPGEGANIFVRALAADGTNIYLGGGFAGAYNDGNFLESRNILKWNGLVFEAMGSPLDPWWGAPIGAGDIAVAGNTVFLAGPFGTAVDHTWDPPWHSPAEGFPYGLALYSKVTRERSGTNGLYYYPYQYFDWNSYTWSNSYKYAEAMSFCLTVQNGSLYLAGCFDGIYDYITGVDTPCKNIARWDGTTWSPLGNPGVEWEAYGLASDSNSVYVGEWYEDPNGATYRGFRRWVTGPDSPCPSTVSVTLDGPSYIYKGHQGLEFPYPGYTWFTIHRTDPTVSSLQVTFLLGGDGTALSSPQYNYKPWFAYYNLDFTASGFTRKLPFPNGFSVTIQPGHSTATIGVQTLATPSWYYQLGLLCTLPDPPPGSAYTVDPAGSQASGSIIDQNVEE